MTAPRLPAPGLLTAAILGIAFVVACQAIFGERGVTGDLFGLWLAGEAFAEGQFAQIYPRDTAFFSLLPPPGWESRAAAYGVDITVYPFLYPPLWAWAVAQLSAVIDLATFERAVSLLNPAFMAATVFLAGRVAAPRMNAGVYLFLGLAVAIVSSVGSIAILSNHLQIFVAFLTVLAIERAEAGASRMAGVALALAAALKLYPAVYALLWLACGQRRAFASFAVAGTALGLLSIAVAGWPLHAELLRLLRVVSNTAVLTMISYTAETALGQLLFADRIVTVSPVWGPPVTWLVLPEPRWFSLCLLAAQIVALAAFAAAFARWRTAASRLWLWPAAMIVLSILSPLSWSYHYVAPVAFAPALIERFGRLTGLAILAAFAVATTPLLLKFDPAVPGLVMPLAVLGTVALLGLAAAFLAAARPRLTSG